MFQKPVAVNNNNNSNKGLDDSGNIHRLWKCLLQTITISPMMRDHHPTRVAVAMIPQTTTPKTLQQKPPTRKTVGISFQHQRSLAQCTKQWLCRHGLAGVPTPGTNNNNNSKCRAAAAAHYLLITLI